MTDDLRVCDDVLWINDCGYDMNGDFVYGNERGVPYKLERVDEQNPALAWTLGKGAATAASPDDHPQGL